MYLSVHTETIKKIKRLINSFEHTDRIISATNHWTLHLSLWSQVKMERNQIFPGAVWACRHGVALSGNSSDGFRYEIKRKCTQKGLRGSAVAYVSRSALKKHSGTVLWLVNLFLISLWVSNSETTWYTDIMYPPREVHHLKFFAENA